MKNRRDALTALAYVLLLLGCVVRMHWIRHEGHFDVRINTEWAISAMRFGLVESYEHQIDGAYMRPNYPPLSLLVFQGVAELHESLAKKDALAEFGTLRLLMKIPANLADALIALMICVMLSRWRSKTQGLLGAAAYWANPAIMYNSAFWGQTDAWFTLCILCCVHCIHGRQPLRAGMFVACSVMFKPQAIIAIPLLIVCIGQQRRQLVRAFAGFATMMTIVSLPFLLAGRAAIFPGYYLHVSDHLRFISNNAYNLWWMILGQELAPLSDKTTAFAGISFERIGQFFFAASYGSIVVLQLTAGGLRRSSVRSHLITCMSVCAVYFSFYLMLTGVHERYLFPAMPFLCIVACMNKGFFSLYAASSIGFFFNLKQTFMPWTVDGRWSEISSLLPTVTAVAHGLILSFLLFALFKMKSSDTQDRNNESVSRMSLLTALFRSVRQSFDTGRIHDGRKAAQPMLST